MTRPKRVPRRALLVAAAAALLGAGALAWFGTDGRPSPPAQRVAGQPTILLVTSLPLIFGEEFSLEGGGSKALQALESRYRVEPIGVTDAKALKHGDVLLMAHALAQPAEALVDLDRWVRRGGRVLILADPMLEWPSSRPLGDRLRPPPGFADTGLLAHWGLKLRRRPDGGPIAPIVDGREVRAVSAGVLRATSRNCSVHGGGLLARCAIGDGKATVIADADFLHIDAIEGGSQSGNLAFLLAELRALER